MTEEGAIFQFPFGDTPLVMYFPLEGPSSQWFQQLLSASAWGTKPLGNIQSLSYHIHRRESKDYLT